MDFISNSAVQIKAMLETMGLESIEELFSAIPPQILLPPPTEEDGLSEYEGLRMMQELGAKNSYPSLKSYLGGGSYLHHIPALVPFITSKSEFLTCYTPYQAEASQGSLQAIFEYQTAISALTGLEVANASVWDGASACAEGALMAARIQNDKKRLLVAETLHPHYFGVVEQYLKSQDIEILRVPFLPSGALDQKALAALIDQTTLALLIQSPNVLGVVEETQAISALVKKEGALLIQCANPLSYGLLASAGETGVDIAVGDTQPFGLPLNFGGPYAGYMATRKEYLRQLPGRLVGKAKDHRGQEAYTLVLQAREQHIRREKALSNICTNQALCALATLVTLLWYGKRGIRELALTNFQRASYLKSLLPHTLSGPIFNEFAWRPNRPVEEVKAHFRKAGIEAGWVCPLFKDHLIVSVTECKSKHDLDRYSEVAHECL